MGTKLVEMNRDGRQFPNLGEMLAPFTRRQRDLQWRYEDALRRLEAAERREEELEMAVETVRVIGRANRHSRAVRDILAELDRRLGTHS